MLFTIIILAALTLIVMPTMYKIVEKQQTKQFFDVLESDIFYIQNQAFGTRENVRIVFDEDYYVILHDRQIEEKKRYYPDHLTHDVKVNNRVKFSNNGTIIDPTTFVFKEDDITYQLVFPLGKGRHYIEEK